MPIPIDFRFSQASLRDYLACPRRFQLRYLERMAWPAIEAEPYIERELHLKRGAFFHRLVEQKLKGIPDAALTALADENNLSDWWAAFLVFHESLPDGKRKSEWTITTHLGNYSLIAKYDLVIPSPDGKLYIYDWKTTTIRTRSEVLRNDIQTRLYLLMTMEASTGFNQPEPILPENVSLCYWFAAFPRDPENLLYSDAQYQRDRVDILDLIEKIATTPEDGFVLTADERQCRFCVYRSFCERGVSAGQMDDLDADAEVESDANDFDFNQAAEVAF